MESIVKQENLSNKELAIISSYIETENKRRANCGATTSVVLSVLRKYKMSIGDKPELGLGKLYSKTGPKIVVTGRAKTARARAKPFKRTDKHVNLAYKYKNRGAQKSGAPRPRTQLGSRSSCKHQDFHGAISNFRFCGLLRT